MSQNFLKSLFLILLSFSLACKSTISKKDTNFAIKDTSSITKIKIIKQKDTLTLTKQNGIWTVNDMYQVDNEQIKRTLNTLFLLDLNMPLPDNAVEKVKNDLQLKGTKIIVYGGNKIFKSLLVGKFIKNSGNYMMLAESQKPYIVYIPSLIFDIRKNFSTDLNFWQSHIIYNFKPSDIQSVYFVDFVNNKKFYLYKNNNWQIADDTASSSKLADNEKVSRYLTYFQNIKFLRFKNKQDSLGNKIFKLTVKTNTGKIYDLITNNLIINNIIDKNLFIGNMNNNFFFIANYYDFDLLRKNSDYFRQKNSN